MAPTVRDKRAGSTLQRQLANGELGELRQGPFRKQQALMRPSAQGMARVGPQAVAQRVALTVGELTFDHKQLLEEREIFELATPDRNAMGQLLSAIAKARVAFESMEMSSTDIDDVAGLEKLRRQVSSKLMQSILAEQYSSDAQGWWDDRRTEGVFEIGRRDPLFSQIASDCLRNHEERPYSTDALHETGPIMGGWLSGAGVLGTLWKMMPALWDWSTYLGKAPTDRPDIVITRIQMIKNQEFLRDFERARSTMDDPNQRLLYSGHGEQGMDFIAEHGHDPSYGPYDPIRKGHGAHGRGAYFSPQVDKAISYSSAGQGPDEERSFFAQEVLLGNVHAYARRGTYKFAHHNEMVRADRSARNKLRAAGVATEGLAEFDSLKGTKTYEPGAGIVGANWHKRQFDSDEYMVRNADQVYVKFRIFYKLSEDG